jgi:hypothetical protein
MFIEALSRTLGTTHTCLLAGLNDKLRHLNSPVTVVAFIIMPAPTNSFSVDALKGQAVMKQLKETVNEIQQSVGRRIFEDCARYVLCRDVLMCSGTLPKSTNLLTEEEIVLLKRRIYTIKKDHLPSIVTHNVADDANDPILNQLRRLHLVNDRHDRVKVIFHPEFLNSNNPLFGLDYDDFVRGCHLGVFPSYYEPWFVFSCLFILIISYYLFLRLLNVGDTRRQNAQSWEFPQSQLICRALVASWKTILRIRRIMAFTLWIDA